MHRRCLSHPTISAWFAISLTSAMPATNLRLEVLQRFGHARFFGPGRVHRKPLAPRWLIYLAESAVPSSRRIRQCLALTNRSLRLGCGRGGIAARDFELDRSCSAPGNQNGFQVTDLLIIYIGSSCGGRPRVNDRINYYFRCDFLNRFGLFWIP